MNDHRLDATGKVVLVTGSTARLRGAVSLALAERDATVLRHDRDRRRLIDTATGTAARALEAIDTARSDWQAAVEARAVPAGMIIRRGAPRLARPAG